MVKLIVLFRIGARAPNFDERYNNFLTGLETLPGLRRKAVCNVYSGPGGRTPYRSVVEAYFDSRQALIAALSSPEGVAVGNDLQDFAGSYVTTVFADVMEADLPADEPAPSS